MRISAALSRADLAWNALTARALGYDFVNLGCSGTAYCEPAVADYMAKQPWDLCVLEISVNMVGGFTVEEFRKRATYMIDNRPFHDETLACIQRLRKDGVFPDCFTIQSWYKLPAEHLPEEGGYSFMHTARDSIRLIRQLFPQPNGGQN
jgi:hypothetical protein